jgi:antitoxin FitA
MATITVKNIPEELYTQLKNIAEANRRSINSEIIICIERRLNSYRPSAEEIVQKARRLRKMTDAYPITAKEFNLAKAAGRP